jgi:hypothetical protein
VSRHKFHPDLQCYLIGITTKAHSHDGSPGVHVARVDVPALAQVDMSGTIRTVLKLDRLVTEIHVYADNVLDISYFMNSDNKEWHARLYEPQQ